MNLKLASEPDGRVLKLKISSLTTTVIAMIFKLDCQEGIYISSEEGEILLPDDTGHFEVQDFSKTYLVNGERARAAVNPRNAGLHVPMIGITGSYQRRSLNPPPGQLPSTSTSTQS